jgi:hypothetical protein
VKLPPRTERAAGKSLVLHGSRGSGDSDNVQVVLENPSGSTVASFTVPGAQQRPAAVPTWSVVETSRPATQVELAQRAGLSRRGISDFEREQRHRGVRKLDQARASVLTRSAAVTTLWPGNWGVGGA